MANPNEIVIGAAGRVYVAPVGTSVPNDPTTPLSGSFIELGLVSSDGCTIAADRSLADVMCWSSAYPARKIVESASGSASFTLQQWNADNVTLAFGGGTVTEPTPGAYRYSPPSASEIDERCMVVEWADGDRTFRFVIPRGMVSDSIEVKLTRTGAADLPVKFACLGSDNSDVWYLQTDDPAFQPAGS